MLRLDDTWIWDSWVADESDRYRLFFLPAPRSLGDLGLRHVNARVGHASPTNLVDWPDHGECFSPSEAGFNDMAIWTGSVSASTGAGGGSTPASHTPATPVRPVLYQRESGSTTGWVPVRSPPRTDLGT